jgi:hypothetical protein
VDDPWETAVARPELFTVAIAVFDEDHVTELVTSAVLVSLQCAVKNCCDAPSGTVGFAGLMLMETIVAPVVAVASAEYML